MKAQALKIELELIKAKKFEVESEDRARELLPFMIANIGHEDMVLRDDLIYTCLYFWLVEYNYFNKRELRALIVVAIDDEHLLLNIHKSDELSVFTRTFSVLLIALILYRHRQDMTIDEALYFSVKDKLLSYYQLERDYRGFDLKYGWAHGIAHCADALDELVGCSECTVSINMEVLERIKCVLNSENNIFNHGEGDRLTQVIHSIYQNSKSEKKDLENWIQSLGEIKGSDSLKLASSYNKFAAQENTKGLLRALYFRFSEENYSSNLLKLIYETERQI